MIEVRELKIDNLVSFKGKNYKIKLIESFSDTVHIAEMEQINIINGLSVHVTELEPVSLSEEVLTMIGAQYHNGNQMLFTSSEIGFIFYVPKDGLIYIGEEDDPRGWKLLHEINSAHKLQNLYNIFRRKPESPN